MHPIENIKKIYDQFCSRHNVRVKFKFMWHKEFCAERARNMITIIRALLQLELVAIIGELIQHEDGYMRIEFYWLKCELQVSKPVNLGD